MDFKELFKEIYSRKAGVAIIAITALVYIGTRQPEEGNLIVTEIVRLAIYGIIGIGSLGIVAQAVLDWRRPKEEGPAEPENTVTEITEGTNLEP